MRLLVAPRDLNRDPQRAQRRTEQSLLSAPRRLGTTVRAPEGSADWDGLVVLCAANNWDDVKLADRHMAERLSAHAPVLYVDPPMSRLTRFNKPSVASSTQRPHLRLVAPRIARYTPVVAPKPFHPAMTALTSGIVRWQLSRVVRASEGASKP